MHDLIHAYNIQNGIYKSKMHSQAKHGLENGL